MNKIYLILCFLIAAWGLYAQSNDAIKSVQLQAEPMAATSSILLTWDDAVPAISDFSVQRRVAGTTSWGTAIAFLPIGTLSYTDTEVEAGTLYEYRVIRNSSSGLGYGYIYSGWDLPAPDQRGILLLVIDDALLPDLTMEIDRYQRDVLADGWFVKTIVVSSNMVDTEVKQMITQRYQEAPDQRHALLLLGDVPVPYSGNIFPDGHDNHQGAWSADVYYGDMDGNWTDEFIDNTSASSQRNHNVPGDGKWDSSIIPSDLELEVGRVDFSGLPAFDEDMITLTRQYLDKNHAYRRKLFTVPERGLIENNFGGFSEGFGQNGLKNFATLVGRDSTSYLDYDNLKTNSYLFSYGCGGGSYQSAGGISNTNNLSNDSLQTIFTFLFGSYFGDWDSQNNFLRAALGSGTVLVNAWAGRPNWSLHPMGMGETIGYCAKLTQNNAGFSYSQGFGSRSVHVALMGDPTLRIYMLAPPTEVTITEELEGMQLSWMPSADADIAGYHVYRRKTDTLAYERITPDLITDLTYLDPCPSLGDSLQYLVKSVRHETTPSGQFFNESSGTEASILVTIDPTVTAMFGIDVMEGEVLFLNQSTNATSYSWDFGDGGTSNELNPVYNFPAGTHEIQLIAENACDSDTSSQTIDIVLTNTNERLTEDLRILPNPVSDGFLQLESPVELRNVELMVVDQSGRIRLHQPFSQLYRESLDLRQLENGHYLLKVKTEQFERVVPILVLRR